MCLIGFLESSVLPFMVESLCQETGETAASERGAEPEPLPVENAHDQSGIQKGRR